jgi:membrane protein required for colicin V production
MNWLDILILVVLAVSVIGGLMAGVIKILFGVVGIILGVVLAGRFGGSLADKLTFISDARTANILSFIVIMIVVLLIAGLLAFIFKKIAEGVMLGWINRLGGAVLGLFMGMILMAAILTVSVKYAGFGGSVENSWMAGFLLNKFPIVLGFLPKEFSTVKDWFN